MVRGYSILLRKENPASDLSPPHAFVEASTYLPRIFSYHLGSLGLFVPQRDPEEP
jgi:hypothetical protein